MWAPGCEEWLEVSSCSNCGDFQARTLIAAAFVALSSPLALAQDMVGVSWAGDVPVSKAVQKGLTVHGAWHWNHW